MKGMPLPYHFEGKGVLGFGCDSSPPLLSDSSASFLLYKLGNNNNNKEGLCLGSEPTSVLDNISSPSLSSSLGGGGGGSCSPTVAAVSGNPSQKWPTVAEISGTGEVEKCGLGLEDWEGVLSESVEASPNQEQSILRWIMGDVDDPSMGLNKMLQMGGSGSPTDFEFNGGFGAVDQVFGFDQVPQFSSNSGNMLSLNPSLLPLGKNGLVPNPSPNLGSYKVCNAQTQAPMFSPILNQPQQQTPPFETSEVKPHVFNPQVLMNQQAQNPGFFLPLPYTQQEQHLLMAPQPKRHNVGGLDPKGPFLDSGQELFGARQQQQQQQQLQHHPQLLPPYLQPRPSMATKPKIGVDEMGHQNQLQQQQQGIIDQLYKAADFVQSGNPVLAQGILARLNHQLSPIGKPFHRAAFYCKEALELLLHTTTNMAPSTANSPFSLIFKIGAYKSFSEISPMIQFANFTCNQALLEALDGFDRIHIVDFDIGYGGQWASFMQELSLRNGGSPALKITAIASPSTHDQLELSLTRENLNHFASEINMAAFEFEIVSLDALNSWSFHEGEAIAVNLPVGSLFSYQVPIHSVLRFIKQLSPRIVVSVDRGCDRTDLPFPNHVIHVLQSYSNMLESLDAVNMNIDALQKIERFLLQPGIEKIVMGRYRSPEKTPHWRTLFLSSGFSPLNFSNFAESQAECVVKRTPVPGFHVEKRHSSLVLCWQRRELVSASVWRC